jgi:hypothetical protein
MSTLARYYDRFGFRKNEGTSAGNQNFAKGSVGPPVLRRGKLKYTTTAQDGLDLPQATPGTNYGGIPRARKEPIIVVPIAKTKASISTL